MMKKYTIIETFDELTNQSITTIQRDNEDGSVTFIPADESNGDYQAYFRWLENPDADESGTLFNKPASDVV